MWGLVIGDRIQAQKQSSGNLNTDQTQASHHTSGDTHGYKARSQKNILLHKTFGIRKFLMNKSFVIIFFKK